MQKLYGYAVICKNAKMQKCKNEKIFFAYLNF